jgi:hypothetical protein
MRGLRSAWPAILDLQKCSFGYIFTQWLHVSAEKVNTFIQKESIVLKIWISLSTVALMESNTPFLDEP